MRIDKLTTKFQQALGDAQSLANGNDQQFIEPQHLLLALLGQDDGGTASLLARAGVNVPALKRDLEGALSRLPKVEGHGGDVQVGRDLGNLLNLTDKEAQKAGDQFIASEMFLLALTQDKGECGRLLKEAGLQRKALEDAVKAVRGGGKLCRRQGERFGAGDQIGLVRGEEGQDRRERRAFAERCAQPVRIEPGHAEQPFGARLVAQNPPQCLERQRLVTFLQDRISFAARQLCHTADSPKRSADARWRSE